MKINSKYKVRNALGEHMILLQGKTGGDMTKMVVLNETAYFLWEKLQNKEFDSSDAVKLLLDTYEVSEEQASNDVKKWVEILSENNLLEES